MHKCLINYKIDNGFWFNESGDKATPVVSVRKADALFHADQFSLQAEVSR